MKEFAVGELRRSAEQGVDIDAEESVAGLKENGGADSPEDQRADGGVGGDAKHGRRAVRAGNRRRRGQSRPATATRRLRESQGRCPWRGCTRAVGRGEIHAMGVGALCGCWALAGTAVKIAGMKPRFPLFVLCVALLGMSVGCMTEKRIYQVSVKNNLAQPITVWLVKEYGPVEQGWESPEDIAESHPITDEFLPSIVVEPGKTRSSTPTEGSFDKMKGRADPRVYLGTPALTEMLAIGAGSLSRLDLLLQPGANSYVVDEEVGKIVGKRVPSTEPAIVQP